MLNFTKKKYTYFRASETPTLLVCWGRKEAIFSRILYFRNNIRNSLQLKILTYGTWRYYQPKNHSLFAWYCQHWIIPENCCETVGRGWSSIHLCKANPCRRLTQTLRDMTTEVLWNISLRCVAFVCAMEYYF